MVLPTWVLVAVSVSMQGQISINAAPNAFATEADCKAFQAHIEPDIGELDLIAYGLNCMQVNVDDHDTSDDPRSKPKAPKPLGKGPKIDV